MTGRIALVGGDEFRQGCEDMDRTILQSTGAQHPNVVVIPTAADKYPSQSAAHGVGYFSGLGANASALMVLNSDHANDQQLVSAVDDADVIYFTGGNPAHLLETLTDSVLLQKIKDALDGGAVLAGSSAGAMVMGSWMRFQTWSDALGIVPGVVTLPHHERSDPTTVAQEIANSAPPGAIALGVDGKTCCFSGPDGWQVVGAGNVVVYKDGEWNRYASGENFVLPE